MKLQTTINKEKLVILLLFCLISSIYFCIWPIQSDDHNLRYIDGSKLSLASLDFWANVANPFPFPLLLKWLNRDVFVTILVQVLISLAVWYGFILTFLRLIKHQAIRYLSIFVLTGFGLSIDSFGWNMILIPESLGNSMLVLYLSTLLLFYQKHGGSPQWKYSTLVLTASLLFCFVREVGAYLVLLVSLGIFAEWAFLFTRQIKSPVLLVTSIAGVLVFVYFQGLGDNLRWVEPMTDSFQQRILVNPEFRDYFAARGMPLQSETRSLNSIDYKSAKQVGLLVHSPEFRAWHKSNGKRVYASFLLSRPVDAFSEVFFSKQELKNVFDEPMGYYVGLHQEGNILPAWYVFLERTLLFPRGANYIFFLSVAAICLIYLFQCRKVAPVIKLSTLMLIGSVGLAFILWQLSPGELLRHTLIPKLMTRLAAFVIILVALDRYADRPTRRKQ